MYGSHEPLQGIMNFGHQLMRVLSNLTSGTRDSSPVRTSSFVIVKSESYITLFLQLLFSLSSVSKSFFPSASSCNLFVWRAWFKFNCVSNCHWKTESRDCFQYSFLWDAGAHMDAVKKDGDIVNLLLFWFSFLSLQYVMILTIPESMGKWERYFHFWCSCSLLFCRKKTLYFMMTWICLFNLQIVMWVIFYSCSFLFYFDGLLKLSTS